MTSIGELSIDLSLDTLNLDQQLSQLKQKIGQINRKLQVKPNINVPSGQSGGYASRGGAGSFGQGNSGSGGGRGNGGSGGSGGGNNQSLQRALSSALSGQQSLLRSLISTTAKNGNDLEKAIGMVAGGQKTVALTAAKAGWEVVKSISQMQHEVSRSVKDSANDFKPSILSKLAGSVGNISNVTTLPLQKVLSGVFERMGSEIVGELSKGISKGIESKVTGSIGSFSLFGEKLIEHGSTVLGEEIEDYLESISGVLPGILEDIMDGIQAGLRDFVGQDQFIIESGAFKQQKVQANAQKRVLAKNWFDPQDKELEKQAITVQELIKSLDQRTKDLVVKRASRQKELGLDTIIAQQKKLKEQTPNEEDITGFLNKELELNQKIDDLKFDLKVAPDQESQEKILQSIAKHQVQLKKIRAARKQLTYKSEQIEELLKELQALHDSIIITVEEELEAESNSIDKGFKQLDKKSKKLEKEGAVLDQSYVVLPELAKEKQTKFQSQVREQVRQKNAASPPKYLKELINDIAKGQDLKPITKDQMPTIKILSMDEAKGSTGDYDQKNNILRLREDVYKSLNSFKLPAEEFRVLLHEIIHGFQVSFGELSTSDAIKQGAMAHPQAIPTKEELLTTDKGGNTVAELIDQSIAPYKKSSPQVQSYVRMAEIDAYTRTERLHKQLYDKYARRQAVEAVYQTGGVSGRQVKLEQQRLSQATLMAKEILKNSLESLPKEAAIEIIDQINQISQINQQLKSKIENELNNFQSLDLEVAPVDEILKFQKTFQKSIKASRTGVKQLTEISSRIGELVTEAKNAAQKKRVINVLEKIGGVEGSKVEAKYNRLTQATEIAKEILKNSLQTIPGDIAKDVMAGIAEISENSKEIKAELDRFKSLDTSITPIEELLEFVEIFETSIQYSDDAVKRLANVSVKIKKLAGNAEAINPAKSAQPNPKTPAPTSKEEALNALQKIGGVGGSKVEAKYNRLTQATEIAKEILKNSLQTIPGDIAKDVMAGIAEISENSKEIKAELDRFKSLDTETMPLEELNEFLEIFEVSIQYSDDVVKRLAGFAVNIKKLTGNAEAINPAESAQPNPKTPAPTSKEEALNALQKIGGVGGSQVEAKYNKLNKATQIAKEILKNSLQTIPGNVAKEVISKINEISQNSKEIKAELDRFKSLDTETMPLEELNEFLEIFEVSIQYSDETIQKLIGLSSKIKKLASNAQTLETTAPIKSAQQDLKTKQEKSKSTIAKEQERQNNQQTIPDPWADDPVTLASFYGTKGRREARRRQREEAKQSRKIMAEIQEESKKVSQQINGKYEKFNETIQSADDEEAKRSLKEGQQIVDRIRQKYVKFQELLKKSQENSGLEQDTEKQLDELIELFRHTSGINDNQEEFKNSVESGKESASRLRKKYARFQSLLSRLEEREGIDSNTESQLEELVGLLEGGDAKDDLKDDDKGFLGFLGKAKKRIMSLVPNIKQLAGSFLSLAVLGNLNKVFYNFLKTSLEVNLKFESLYSSLKFLSGGAFRASQNFAAIRDEAKRLSVAFTPVLEGFIQFSSAVRGTPLERQSKKIFGSVSQAASVMGLNDETSGRAFIAVQQMAAKGKISAEEFRGQLSEALPQSTAVAARALGVTTEEFARMLDTGQLLSQDFLPRFADQLAKETEGGVAGAANTSRAAVNRFNNSLLELQMVVGQTVAPFQKFALNAASMGLDALSTNGKVLSQTLLGIGGILTINMLGTLQTLLKLPIGVFIKQITEKITASSGVIKTSLKTAALQFTAIFGALELFSLGNRLFKGGELAQEFQQLGDAATDAAKGIRDAKAAREEWSSKSPPPSNWSDSIIQFGRDAWNLENYNIPGKNAIARASNNQQVKGAFDMLTMLPGANFLRTGDIFKNAVTFAERDRDLAVGSINNAADAVDKALFDARMVERDPSKAGLPQVQAIDKQLAAVAQRRRTLQATIKRDFIDQGKLVPPEFKQQLADINAEFSKLTEKRSEAAKPAADQLNRVNKVLDETRARLDLINSPEGAKQFTNASQPIEELRATLESTVKKATEAKNIYEKLLATAQADPILFLSNAFRLLNIQLANNNEQLQKNVAIAQTTLAKRQISGFGNDYFASQRASLANAELERNRLREEMAIQQSSISARRSQFAGPAPSAVLEELGVTVDSTAAEIQDRIDRLPDGEEAKKRILENLKQIREDELKLHQTRTQLAQADLSVLQQTETTRVAVIQKAISDQDAAIRRSETAKIQAVRQRQKDRKITEEQAAAEIAQIQIGTIQQQIMLAEDQLKAYQESHKAGLISAQTYMDKERELVTQLSDLKKQKIEQEIQAREALKQRILAQLELENQSAAAAIRSFQSGASIQIKNLQAAGLINSDEAARRTYETNKSVAELEVETTRTKIQRITMLEQRGVLSAREATAQRIQLYTDLGQQQLALIDLEYQEQQRLRQVAIARIDDQIRAEQRLQEAKVQGLEVQRQEMDILLQQQDLAQKLSESRRNLSKAVSDSRIAQSEIQLEALKRSEELAGKLGSDNLDPNVAAMIRRQLREGGFNTQAIARQAAFGLIETPNGPQRRQLNNLTDQQKLELAILDKRQALENQIAAQKKAAQEAEMAHAQAMLQLELQRNELQAKQALLAAKRQDIESQGQIQSAQGEIRKAEAMERGRERDRALADAQSRLDLAQSGRGIAQEAIAVAQNSLAAQKELAANAQAALNAQQQSELAQTAAADAARTNAQQLERAEKAAKGMAQGAKETASQAKEAALSFQFMGVGSADEQQYKEAKQLFDNALQTGSKGLLRAATGLGRHNPFFDTLLRGTGYEDIANIARNMNYSLTE